jgi:hypothetical protein
VAALSTGLARARAALRRALAREAAGPLPPEARRRVRALRLELEGYRLALRRYAREYERLRRRRRAAAPAAPAAPAGAGGP